MHSNANTISYSWNSQTFLLVGLLMTMMLALLSLVMHTAAIPVANGQNKDHPKLRLMHHEWQVFGRDYDVESSMHDYEDEKQQKNKVFDQNNHQTKKNNDIKSYEDDIHQIQSMADNILAQCIANGGVIITGSSAACSVLSSSSSSSSSSSTSVQKSMKIQALASGLVGHPCSGIGFDVLKNEYRILPIVNDNCDTFPSFDKSNTNPIVVNQGNVRNTNIQSKTYPTWSDFFTDRCLFHENTTSAVDMIGDSLDCTETTANALFQGFEVATAVVDDPRVSQTIQFASAHVTGNSQTIGLCGDLLKKNNCDPTVLDLCQQVLGTHFLNITAIGGHIQQQVSFSSCILQSGDMSAADVAKESQTEYLSKQQGPQDPEPEYFLRNRHVASLDIKGGNPLSCVFATTPEVIEKCADSFQYFPSVTYGTLVPIVNIISDPFVQSCWRAGDAKRYAQYHQQQLQLQEKKHNEALQAWLGLQDVAVYVIGRVFSVSLKANEQWNAPGPFGAYGCRRDSNGLMIAFEPRGDAPAVSNGDCSVLNIDEPAISCCVGAVPVWKGPPCGAKCLIKDTCPGF